MIYEVICEWSGEENQTPTSFHAGYSKERAENELDKQHKRLIELYNSGSDYWKGKSFKLFIKEIDDTDLFKIPPPNPTWTLRYPHGLDNEDFAIGAKDVQHYDVFIKPKESKLGVLGTLDVEIVPRGEGTIFTYSRRYPGFLNTFYPFYHRHPDGTDHPYALFSGDYTITSVVSLETGDVVASEESDPNGFCPWDFYVPSWYDVHEGRIPGTLYWENSCEQPTGQYGFVAGCIWGDDSSAKLEYLDLSLIHEGKISREDRYGYLEVDISHAHLAEVIDVWGHGILRVSQEVHLKIDGKTHLLCPKCAADHNCRKDCG